MTTHTKLGFPSQGKRQYQPDASLVSRQYTLELGIQAHDVDPYD